MDRDLIGAQLLELLKENGFNIQTDSNEQEDSLIDMDSLQYISFIADVEEKFDIAIPDEFLIKSDGLHVSDFVNLIADDLKTGSNKEACIKDNTMENSDISVF